MSGFPEPILETILEIWRRGIDRLANRYGQRRVEEAGLEGPYFHARARARAGDLESAARQFADVAAMEPTFAPAVEAHAEAADRMGQRELARSKYLTARKLRAQARSGAPDRCFVVRNRGPFASEIAAYSTVLRSVTQRPLPYVARGNAFLAEGRAKLALVDYGCALSLKPDLHEVIALRAEALLLLGRYKEALSAFDSALAGCPNDAEIRGGRAIAYLALDRLDAARADWRRQLELLPPERASARACVLLRLADYEAALPELERALEKEPADPYWRLYRLTSLRLLGRTAARPGVEGAASDGWPGPLFALHAGQLSADEVLEQADNEGRRAEALFQVGVVAWPHDREEARRRWQEVADKAAKTLIEYAAARHALARPGA